MFGLLKNIFIFGSVFSTLLTIIGFLLFLSALRNKKYANKLVQDTPLLKYSEILLFGIILSAVFYISILILKFIECV